MVGAGGAGRVPFVKVRSTVTKGPLQIISGNSRLPIPCSWSFSPLGTLRHPLRILESMSPIGHDWKPS